MPDRVEPLSYNFKAWNSIKNFDRFKKDLHNLLALAGKAHSTVDMQNHPLHSDRGGMLQPTGEDVKEHFWSMKN